MKTIAVDCSKPKTGKRVLSICPINKFDNFYEGMERRFLYHREIRKRKEIMERLKSTIYQKYENKNIKENNIYENLKDDENQLSVNDQKIKDYNSENAINNNNVQVTNKDNNNIEENKEE